MNAACRLLEVDIPCLTVASLVSRLEEWLEAGVPRRVYTLRAGVLTEAAQRRRLRQILCESDLNLAGGEELRLAARLTRQPVPDLLTPELWLEPLLERLVGRGRSLWYLGGTPGAAEAFVEELRQAFPGLEAFARDGTFEKWGPENDRVVTAVAGSRPGVVLVGLGSPYQEEYAHAHADLFRAPLTLTVGSLAETRTGIWPRGPLGTGGSARVGGLLNGPVRRAAGHLVDPLFLARVLRSRPTE